MTTEELKNAAGFKAVDAEGNDLGVVTLSDIVTAVKEELAQSQPAARAASVSTLSEVSTLAATDTYEDQLPQKTDVTWIRGLDESGNPILISKQSLVSVAEGLIGLVSATKNGLMSKEGFIYRGVLNGKSHGPYDFNDFTNSGIYSYTNINNSNNKPGLLGWGTLVVFKSGFIVQVAFEYRNVYVRMRGGISVSQEWSDWKEL